MGRSVASAARVTEGQSVADDYLPLVGEARRQESQVSAGNSVASVDLCALLAEAIDANGARKSAAIDMQISAPVLTKQLQRTDNASPSLARMGLLKRAILVDFAHRILAACDAEDLAVARRQAVEEAVRAIGRLVGIAMGA